MKIMKKAKQPLRILYHVVSKVKIPLLVVCVGQACTLKCRDCSNFSPYAKKERLLYPVNDVLEDLDNILSVSKYIDLLQIQGGEPLIYPSLENILHYVISNDKIKHVHIATNGTVIPYKHLELLKHEKITVRISNYKVVDQSEVDQLCRVLEDNNIKYSLYSFTGGDNRWILQGG